MTQAEIEADSRNVSESRIDEIDADGGTHSLIVVQFHIEESTWNDIRNGTKAGMKSFLDWVDPEDA